ARVRAAATADCCVMWRARLSNGETREVAARLLPRHPDVLDDGAARAASAPLDQHLELLALALEDCLDAAVRLVRDPALYAARTRAVAQLGAEEDALNPAPDPYAGARLTHGSPRRRSAARSGTAPSGRGRVLRRYEP